MAASLGLDDKSDNGENRNVFMWREAGKLKRKDVAAQIRVAETAIFLEAVSCGEKYAVLKWISPRAACEKPIVKCIQSDIE
jgi:hypothetical protein